MTYEKVTTGLKKKSYEKKRHYQLKGCIDFIKEEEVNVTFERIKPTT